MVSNDMTLADGVAISGGVVSADFVNDGAAQ